MIQRIRFGHVETTTDGGVYFVCHDTGITAAETLVLIQPELVITQSTEPHKEGE